MGYSVAWPGSTHHAVHVESASALEPTTASTSQTRRTLIKSMIEHSGFVAYCSCIRPLFPRYLEGLNPFLRQIQRHVFRRKADTCCPPRTRESEDWRALLLGVRWRGQEVSTMQSMWKEHLHWGQPPPAPARLGAG